MLGAPNVQVWLSAIAFAYLAIGLVFVIIVWKLASRRRTKIIGALLAIGLLASWPIYEQVKSMLERYAFQERYKIAAARFAERCKIAGDKIVRTVDNVEGILVLKMRTTKEIGNGHEQYAPSAAFYRESADEWYLKSFLWSEERLEGKRGRLYDRRTSPDFPGYGYVDFVDPTDNKRYRYHLVEKHDGRSSGSPSRVLERELAVGPAPRYGLTFVDLVDPEDRDHWIAGSVVKVVDLQTGEEIARHTRLAFDRGLGASGGGRQAWAYASFCPVIGPLYAAQTRHFVDQVLKPKAGIPL